MTNNIKNLCKLADALIDVLEHYVGFGPKGDLLDDGLFCNEEAIRALIEAGFVEVKNNRYFVKNTKRGKNHDR